MCSDLGFAWSRLVIFSRIRAVDQKTRVGAQISWHLPHLSMGGGEIPKRSTHIMFNSSQRTFLLSGHKTLLDAAQKLSQRGAPCSWRAPEPVQGWWAPVRGGLTGAGQVESQRLSFPELGLQRALNVPARVSPAI